MLAGEENAKEPAERRLRRMGKSNLRDHQRREGTEVIGPGEGDIREKMTLVHLERSAGAVAATITLLACSRSMDPGIRLPKSLDQAL